MSLVRFQPIGTIAHEERDEEEVEGAGYELPARHRLPRRSDGDRCSGTRRYRPRWCLGLERLLLPLFSPYISEGEIANLAAYNFYARLSSVLAQEPLSGVTLLLEDDGSEAVRNAVIEASRETYAKKPEREDKKEVSKRTTKKTSMKPQNEVKQKASKVIVPPGG